MVCIYIECRSYTVNFVGKDKYKLNEDMIVAVVVLRMRKGIKNGILD